MQERRGDCDNDKGNIFVVICDTDIQYSLKKSYWRLWNIQSDTFQFNHLCFNKITKRQTLGSYFKYKTHNNAPNDFTFYFP